MGASRSENPSLLPGWPAFTVVIPCYNQARYLLSALDSVLAQEYPHRAVIVVNDGSTDDTSELVRACRQASATAIYLIEQENQGQARARQRGLDEARGDWLIMLDADDLLEPGALALGAEQIRRGRADVLVGNARIVAEDGVTQLAIQRQARRPAWPSVLRMNPIGSLAAAWARVEAVRSVGGLAVEGVAGSEDWDLWVRMTRAGMRFTPVDAILASYRQSGGSYSRRLLPMLEAAINVLDRAARPDERIQNCKHGPIDARDYQIFRNSRVFGSLGTALGIAADEHTILKILDQLVPGALDPTDCIDQLLGNMQAALRDAGKKKLDAPILSSAMREKFEKHGFGELVQRIDPVLRNPWQKRSLRARLRDRF